MHTTETIHMAAVLLDIAEEIAADYPIEANALRNMAKALAGKVAA